VKLDILLEDALEALKEEEVEDLMIEEIMEDLTTGI
jgi:hypothetical protein